MLARNLSQLAERVKEKDGDKKHKKAKRTKTAVPSARGIDIDSLRSPRSLKKKEEKVAKLDKKQLSVLQKKAADELIEKYKAEQTHEREEREKQKTLENLLRTPGKSLVAAAASGNLEHLEYLLDHNANINEKAGHLESSALMTAVRYEQLDAAKLLLEDGARIHACDVDGHTALMICACTGNVKMLQLLLQYDADPTVTDRFGQTALTLAYQHGHSAFASKLIHALATRPAPDNSPLSSVLSPAALTDLEQLTSGLALAQLTGQARRGSFGDKKSKPGAALTAASTLAAAKKKNAFVD